MIYNLRIAITRIHMIRTLMSGSYTFWNNKDSNFVKIKNGNDIDNCIETKP